MIFVTIVDAQGVEQVRNEVTEAIPQDLLEAAARVTCEVWNRDHPEDGWETVIVKTNE
jgi:hypothetical protein